jgi:hypothetical protein
VICGTIHIDNNRISIQNNTNKNNNKTTQMKTITTEEAGQSHRPSSKTLAYLSFLAPKN